MKLAAKRRNRWIHVALSAQLLGPTSLGAGVSSMLSMLVTMPVNAAPVNLDRIVAVVGPRIILRSELEIELQVSPLVAAELAASGSRPTPEQIMAKQAELTPKVLDALIGDHLVLLEAEKYPTLALTDAELESYLQNIAQGNQLGSVAKLRAEVERAGDYGTWEQYRATMRRQVGVYKVEVSLVPSAEVSDAEVLAQYRELGRDEDTRVHATRWAFRGADGEAQARDAIAKLKKAKTTLPKSVAAPPPPAGEEPESNPGTSEAPPSEVTPSEAQPAQPLPGGVELEIRRGETAPAVGDALFGAKAGDVLGPFKVGEQWLVYSVKDVQASNLAPFEEVKEQLRDRLRAERRGKELEAFRERLRARNHVEIRL